MAGCEAGEIPYQGFLVPLVACYRFVLAGHSIVSIEGNGRFINCPTSTVMTLGESVGGTSAFCTASTVDYCAKPIRSQSGRFVHKLADLIHDHPTSH